MNRDVKIALLDRETPIDVGQRVYALLFGDETSSDFMLVWRRIAPGRPLGDYHMHAKSENIIVVLDGVLDAVIGGKRYKVNKNEVILMPAGVPHATGNLGDTEVHAVEFYAPSRGEGSDMDNIPATMPDELVDGEAILVSIPTETAVQRPPNVH